MAPRPPKVVDHADPAWPQHPRLRLLIAALAGGLAFLFSYGPGAYRMRLDVSVVVGAATAGVVWLAGRAPRVAFGLAVALSFALPVMRSSFQAMEWIVLLVAVQVLVTTELSVPLLAVGMLAALTVNDAWLRIADGRAFLHPSVLGPAIITALAVGVGVQGRRLRRANAELRLLRDRDRQRAVLDERRRMARVVHDEVGHHASAIAVRSGLALQSAAARDLEASVAFAGRTAQEMLQALRRALELLDEDPTTIMDGAVRRMREAGLEVSVTGVALHELPAPTALTVAHVAQEALTNVLRHRGPGPCWITLERRANAVELLVEDDGSVHATPMRPDPAPRASHGLVAMQERATSLGGTVRAGVSPRGGWCVHLLLPVS